MTLENPGRHHTRPRGRRRRGQRGLALSTRENRPEQQHRKLFRISSSRSSAQDTDHVRI